MSNQIQRNKTSKYFSSTRRALYAPQSSYALTGGVFSALTVDSSQPTPGISLNPDKQTFEVVQDGIYSIQWSVMVNGDPASNLVETYLELDADPNTSLGFSSSVYTQNGRGYYGTNSSANVYLQKSQLFSIKVYLTTGANIRSALGTGDNTTETKVQIMKLA